MSETVTCTGEIKKINIPKELSIEEQIKLLKELGHKFEDEEYYSEDSHPYSETLEFICGVWYDTSKVKKTNYGSSIAEAIKISEDTFQIVCQFYNGGASFNEVLEEALQEYKEEKKG